MTRRQKLLKVARNQRLVLDYIKYLVQQRGVHLCLSDSILSEVHRLTIGDMYPCAGNYRDPHFLVQLNGREVPPAYAIRYSIADLFHELNNDQRSHFISKAANLHYRLTEIHPFNGGNGRVARALMTLIFLCAGVHEFVPVELIGWMKRHRDQYIDGLRAGRKSFDLFVWYGTFCVFEKMYKQRGDRIRLMQIREAKRALKRQMRPALSRKLPLFEPRR